MRGNFAMKSLIRILVGALVAVIGGLASFFILSLPITLSFIVGGISGGAAIALIERFMLLSHIEDRVAIQRH